MTSNREYYSNSRDLTKYTADPKRYETMTYKRCGHSGLRLPVISLGLWHNFGGVDVFETGRSLCLRAFDRGVTHFDLANNYGPPYGSAEETFGRILAKDLHPYRDEMIISTKAGYDMWDGPYGNWGSRKYMLASLDQSLQRMGLDYVDIFYHHRPDPETPLEESMGALATAVQQGKALYVGISNYKPDRTREAAKILKDMGVPLLIHQPRYSMFDRWIEEEGLTNALQDCGVGSIVFSPLAQGLLTDRYLNGVPEDSRAAKSHGHLQKDRVDEATVAKIRALNDLAQERGQSLAQMSLAWVLRLPQVTTALIGASRLSQLDQNLDTINNLSFTDGELKKIETILAK